MDVRKFYNNSPAEGCFFAGYYYSAINNICPGQRFFCHVISLQYLCRFLVSDVPPTECEEELRFEHGFGISFCKC